MGLRYRPSVAYPAQQCNYAHTKAAQLYILEKVANVTYEE